jgi:VHL beta domain
MLDANLVAAVWGAIALYGVLASLITPRTDTNYRTFLKEGTEETYKAAKYWTRVTISIPLVALLTVLAVSLIAILQKNGVPLTWPPTSSLWVILIGLASQVVFLVFVGLLVPLFMPPYYLKPGNLRELNERDESGNWKVRSRDYTSPTIIWFVNATDTPISLYWCDYEGQEVPYDPPLASKDRRSQGTFDTHPWVARVARSENETKNETPETPVALFVARKLPGGALITSSEAPSDS